MSKQIYIVFLVLWTSMAVAQKPTHYYVRIETAKGTGVLQLYNETPKHRNNFVKLVKEGYYDSLLFHRVIHNFMIQGGDPDSKFAADRVQLGEGGPNYKIPAEISPALIHKKGVIGAARDNNPAKQSSASQFYLVQGRKFTKAGLDSLETFRLKGKKLSDKQRQAYMSEGGTPHLDGEYTVFGELISGLDLIDQIAAVKTDSNDRPLSNERMAMKLLTRREAIDLERQQKGLPPKKGLFTALSGLFKSQYYKL